MRHNLVLYIVICLMQFIILTNITLLDEQWNGVVMFLCTFLFIFASTIFGLSRQNKKQE